MNWPEKVVENARDGKSYCRDCPAQGDRSQRVHPGYFNCEDAEIMFVGTEPTHDPRWDERENFEEYNQTSGESWLSREDQDGDVVNQIVEDSIGIDIRETWVGDSIKCPPNGKTSEPRIEEFEYCQHYLKEEIELVDPSILITLGNLAARKTLKVLGEDYGRIQSTIDCGKILDTDPPIIISPHYDRNYLTSEPKKSWGRGWAHYCHYLDPPYSSNLEIVQDALKHLYSEF